MFMIDYDTPETAIGFLAESFKAFTERKETFDAAI